MIKDVEKNINFKSLNIYEKGALLLGIFFHDAILTPPNKKIKHSKKKKQYLLITFLFYIFV